MKKIKRKVYKTFGKKHVLGVWSIIKTAIYTSLSMGITQLIIYFENVDWGAGKSTTVMMSINLVLVLLRQVQQIYFGKKEEGFQVVSNYDKE